MNNPWENAPASLQAQSLDLLGQLVKITSAGDLRFVVPVFGTGGFTFQAVDENGEALDMLEFDYVGLSGAWKLISTGGKLDLADIPQVNLPAATYIGGNACGTLFGAVNDGWATVGTYTPCTVIDWGDEPTPSLETVCRVVATLIDEFRTRGLLHNSDN
jgi:hypothetical protein